MVFTPVHFVVPFSMTSVVPDIIVIPLVLSVIGAEALPGLKLVIVCVWRSVPSTWTIVKLATKFDTLPPDTVRFHVPARMYGI